MAAPIVTTATTLEGQLFEVAIALQAAEAAVDLVLQPDFEQLVTLSADPEANEMTVTATMPATVSGVGGALSFSPVAYL